MQRQRRRDSAAELALRSELHRRGMRFYVDRRVDGLPRHRVDILFTRVRLAVYIDGCFWHGCPEHRTNPRANADWWREKIDNNRRRDQRADDRLKELGWEVIRVWEHESAESAADRVEAAYTAAAV